MTALLELEQVSVKGGGRWLLDRLSLAVAAGETVVVTGPNGSGKSLLARVAAGLVAPSAGRVLVNERPVGRSRSQHLLGYLPQTGGIYEYLTVAEELRFYAASAGVVRRNREKVCADLLELTGLTALTEVPGARLTQGQRRRLSIGRALVGDPQVLVLDEPLTGLDAEGRADMRNLLHTLAGMGKAVLITTGDPDGLSYDRLLKLGRKEEG